MAEPDGLGLVGPERLSLVLRARWGGCGPGSWSGVVERVRRSSRVLWRGEVARLLGLEERLVGELLRSGELVGYCNRHRRWVVDREDLLGQLTGRAVADVERRG